MATYEDGYSQSLLDMKTTVCMLVNEPNIPNDGKVELLGEVSLITEMINGAIEWPTKPVGYEVME